MATSISAASVLTAQSGLQQSRMNQMLQQSTSAVKGKEDAKIDKSAQDFECMLLGTWLQQAEQSFATVPGADDGEDGAQRDQMMSLGVQSLSESLAASGGIGIAKMVSKALHATADKADGVGQTEASGGDKVR